MASFSVHNPSFLLMVQSPLFLAQHPSFLVKSSSFLLRKRTSLTSPTGDSPVTGPAVLVVAVWHVADRASTL